MTNSHICNYIRIIRYWQIHTKRLVLFYVRIEFVNL